MLFRKKIPKKKTKLIEKQRETKKKKEVKRRSKASLFGVAGEEMAGLVGDDYQRYSMVEIGAGESDLRVREAAWWE